MIMQYARNSNDSLNDDAPGAAAADNRSGSSFQIGSIVSVSLPSDAAGSGSHHGDTPIADNHHDGLVGNLSQSSEIDGVELPPNNNSDSCCSCSSSPESRMVQTEPTLRVKKGGDRSR